MGLWTWDSYIVKATDLADIAWDKLILMFNCLSEIELFFF